MKQYQKTFYIHDRYVHATAAWSSSVQLKGQPNFSELGITNSPKRINNLSVWCAIDCYPSHWIIEKGMKINDLTPGTLHASKQKKNRSVRRIRLTCCFSYPKKGGTPNIYSGNRRNRENIEIHSENSKTSHFLESPHTNKLLRYRGRLKCPTPSPKPSPDRIQKELRRENTILKYQ